MTIIVNEITLDSFAFSGGECHVKVPPSIINKHTKILAKLHNSHAIMELLMTVDAIRQINPQTHIHLTIPYFPYARQDRVCNEGEAFGAKVMADLINQLNCDSVTLYDPHSEITVNAINRCRIITLPNIILNSPLAIDIKQYDMTLVSPDKGAREKISEIAKKINATPIYASKVRDSKTGKIRETTLHGDPRNKNCIILDDICDGGATFIELAKLLKSRGANNLYLYITHGIFSKGLEALKPFFKHVYCYHTFLTADKIDPHFLTVFEKKENNQQEGEEHEY